MNEPPVQILSKLVNVWHTEDEEQQKELGSEIVQFWQENNGAVGLINQVKKELNGQGPAPEAIPTSLKMYKIFSEEDVFGEEKNMFLREIIAVGREVETGKWFDMSMMLETGGLQKEEDVEWVSLGRVEEDGTLYRGELYLDVSDSSPEERSNPVVLEDDEGPDVLECFRKIARKVAASMNEGTDLVIALAGKCGCGKSTELPKILLAESPKLNIVIVEPRRQVAVDNASWMTSGKQEHWEKEQKSWPEEEAKYQKRVRLSVGTFLRPSVGEIDYSLSKRDFIKNLLNEEDDVGTSTYVSTGIFLNAVTSVVRYLNISKNNFFVVIISDWEEKSRQMAQCVRDTKRLAKKLGVPCILILASQSELKEPWLSWVKGDMAFEHLYAPSSLKQIYATGSPLSRARYRFLTPSASNFNPLCSWGNELMRFVKNMAYTILGNGGTLLVKLLTKIDCFRFALYFQSWQASLVESGVLSPADVLFSIPYSSSQARVPTMAKRTVLWCTDIIVYGHNIPMCRGIISCGLRNVLQYNKCFGIAKLRPHLNSKQAWWQVCGRIDREHKKRGVAISLLSLSAQARPKESEQNICHDEYFLVQELKVKTDELQDIETISRVSGAAFASFTAGVETNYCIEVLNLNYCFNLRGPSTIRNFREYLSVLTRKLAGSPVRWSVAALQLLQLYVNKPGGQCPGVLHDPNFRHAFVMMIKYIAFGEGGEDWVMSNAEATWRDNQGRGGFQDYSVVLQLVRNDRDESHCVWDFYGGSGYGLVRWLDGVFSVDVNTHQSDLSNKAKSKDFDKVFYHLVWKRKAQKVALFCNNFLQGKHGSGLILREVFRLLWGHRWDRNNDVEQFQFALCNTRPLQVAKISCKLRTDAKGTMFAKTVVSKKLVCFRDDKLQWKPEVRVGSCGCSIEEQKDSRYIYFGELKDREATVFGPVFAVAQTFAIAHNIGCELEAWVRRGGVGGRLLNMVPIVITKPDKLSDGQKCLGVEINRLEAAVASSFEEDYLYD